MKNVPPLGVMLTRTPSVSSSDVTIGPTAATTIRLKLDGGLTLGLQRGLHRVLCLPLVRTDQI